VRRMAADAGLEGHSAPESQEICFVPDDDHRRFLRERLGELQGDIVDTEGRILGRHEGTYNYTIGQRKGLGIAAAEPLYVIGVDAKERRVVIGTADEGLVGVLQVDGLTWHRDFRRGPLTLQVRSAGTALPVDTVEVTHGRLTAVLKDPASGVAPGQTAVVYQEDRVMLAGTIDRAGGQQVE
jgi:tRNA-specific 2-thiouridylase